MRSFDKKSAWLKNKELNDEKILIDSIGSLLGIFFLSIVLIALAYLSL